MAGLFLQNNSSSAETGKIPVESGIIFLLGLTGTEVHRCGVTGFSLLLGGAGIVSASLFNPEGTVKFTKNALF